MGYNFLPYDQDQLYLLPPSINEWVPEGSLPRFVDEVVETLDMNGRLQGFYERYRADGWGRAAYHPKMMVKVLIYAYCHGITSSRRIARGLENDVGLRYLSANQQPDFRTIADFRRDNLDEIRGLHIEVLELCREAGLMKMGRVALDGRKVAGNAALARNRTREALKAEVTKILDEAERVDTEEDALYGEENRGDELPEELRSSQGRLQRLQQAMQRLEETEDEAQQAQEQKIAEREKEETRTGKKKRGRKPKAPEEMINPEAKANTTDPDSRIMKTRMGYVQGYNCQAVVDCQSQVIVAQAVTQDENDCRQLEPMLEECEKQAGERPEKVSADAGYWSEENAGLGDDLTELFIATKKDWKQRKALAEQGPPRGRIPENATARDRMERKLLTKQGRDVYRQRGSTVEPVFGQMSNRGLNRFVMRGREKVGMEWSLWSTTHNILKLWRSGYAPEPAGW